MAKITIIKQIVSEKFSVIFEILKTVSLVSLPDASFYFWLPVPMSDTLFAQQLYRDYNVSVLPGSYFAREAHGMNPGANFVRIALVASLAECVEAAERIKKFMQSI